MTAPTSDLLYKYYNSLFINDCCFNAIRTPYSNVIRTPYPNVIRTPYPNVIRTPYPNVIRTGYPNVIRTPYLNIIRTPCPFPNICQRQKKYNTLIHSILQSRTDSDRCFSTFIFIVMPSANYIRRSRFRENDKAATGEYPLQLLQSNNQIYNHSPIFY